mmetsp:Transcript_124654/g.364044  ORF Transcript_124654/g.364044 Transcript_124654/m.364044 type:complete len:291 (-) Transcript_124654:64-936(-)
MAAEPGAELSARCRELRELRAEGGGAAQAGRLLSLLGRLAALPVSRPLLLTSGAGREVNRPWLHGHPCAAVRDHSRRLVRCWRQLLTLQAAGEAAAAEAAAAKVPTAEAPTAAPATPEPGAPGGSELEGCSVQELKARLASLGVSCSRCVEKAELVALLRGAAGRRRRSLLGGKAAGGRPSMGRKSMLKVLHRVKWAKAPEPAEASAQLEGRLRRITQAADDCAALGLVRARLQGLPQEERAELVRQRWRSLALQAHPDKVPKGLQVLATRAFGRLEAARARLLGAKGGG